MNPLFPTLRPRWKIGGTSRVQVLLRKWIKLRPFTPGSLVYVRYLDHVLFKDSDASQYGPWVRECVGWLDYEDHEYIRIIWERFLEPNPPDNARLRSTGLAILRKAILEIRKIA